MEPLPDNRRRILAVGSAAAAVVAVVVFAVAAMAGHSPATSATGTGGAGNAPVSATSASTAKALPTPDPAVVASAGREYLAAATVVNGARDTFGATLRTAMTKPCTCPAGEFDASTALAQIPSIETDLTALKVALGHIRSELPGFEVDIAAVIADTDREARDFATAFYDFQHNDSAAMSTALSAAAADDNGGVPDFRRIRADLGLPPPPGG